MSRLDRIHIVEKHERVSIGDVFFEDILPRKLMMNFVLSDIMGCTGTKAAKTEGNIERYQHELFEAAQTGRDRRLRDILDDLDKRKAIATKKEILNTGMSIFT